MASSFFVNENNNIQVKNGMLVLARDIDAIGQQCKRLMQSRIDEFLYAQGRGIDYFGNPFSNSPNVVLFESDARTQVLSVSGVVSIPDFEAVVVDNTMTYSMTIRTIYGETSING